MSFLTMQMIGLASMVMCWLIVAGIVLLVFGNLWLLVTYNRPGNRQRRHNWNRACAAMLLLAMVFYSPRVLLVDVPRWLTPPPVQPVANDDDDGDPEPRFFCEPDHQLPREDYRKDRQQAL